VRIQVGRKPDGKPNYLIQTFDKKSDAVKFKNKILRERDQGLAVVPERITMDEYLDRWLEGAKRNRVKANTYESYEETLQRYVRPYIGSRRLDQLTTLELQMLMTQLSEKGLSPRTVRYAYGLIRDALGQAVKWGMLARNVALNVEPPRQKRPEIQALTEEQVTSFLDAIKGDAHETLLRFLIFTGVRPSEAFGLKWSDVDLKRGTVEIRRSLTRTKKEWFLGETKTAAARRSIPITEGVSRMLTNHRRQQSEMRMKHASVWQDHDFVFTDEIGGPLRKENVLKRHFRPALRRADLPDTFRLYDLRHTCATLMLSQKLNPKVAAERLGHSTVKITLDTYSHVTPTMQQEASEKLEAILGNGDSK
jgi:integrase